MLTAIASILLAAACANSPTTDGNGERHKENQVDQVKDGPRRGGVGQATPADAHEAQYAKLLDGRRKPNAKVLEDKNSRIGGWRFFQQQEVKPGGMMFFTGRAAVDGKGHAVAPRLTSDNAWHALLTTGGLDAVGALERVAWVYQAQPVSKSGEHAPISDPKAKALVTDPMLEKTKTSVRFVGWFARPPDFDPWRTTIEAPASGPAKVAEEMWHELPPP